ncbi:MAG: RimK/LysX family protein [Pseudomonadales bacterium]
MKTNEYKGRRRLAVRLESVAYRSLLLIPLTLLGACAMPQRSPNPELMDNLSEMQIRIRLLQTEVSSLRASLAERQARDARSATSDVVLQQQLDALQSRIAELPETLTGLCPTPLPAATVTAQCEPGPQATRVMVSGDKLVVGEAERVWIDPPGAFLDARMAPASEVSSLTVSNVVEFERDGNKWVRFETQLGKDAATAERALKRTVRVNGDSQRRPAVELRVQLGDVREKVEIVLVELPATDADDGADAKPASREPAILILGRNFLTDVALVDIARKHVQPAFKAPK